MFLLRIPRLFALLLIGQTILFTTTALAFQESGEQSASEGTAQIESSENEPAEDAHEFTEDEIKAIMSKAQEDYQTEKELGPPGLIQHDAVIFGMLLAILGFVFYTSNSEIPGFKRFYKLVPMLLMLLMPMPMLMLLIPTSLLTPAAVLMILMPESLLLMPVLILMLLMLLLMPVPMLVLMLVMPLPMRGVSRAVAVKESVRAFFLPIGAAPPSRVDPVTVNRVCL